MRGGETGGAILVTGMPRSGTTWVGRMLHASGATTYVAEPLNIWRHPRPFRSQTDGWPGYPYVTGRNERAYLPVLADLVGLRIDLLRELRAARTREEVAAIVSTWVRFLFGRARGRRPLLKEPHAFFLAPWFAERLSGQVVVTVRHPAAVVSSWKRLRWPVDLDQLLDQELLVKDWLGPFEAELVVCRSSHDTVEKAALLWKVVYHYIDRVRDSSDALHVVRHEDLSAEPVAGFRELCEALDLPFSNAVRHAVRRATSAQNPKEIDVEDAYAVRVDSRANLENWKRRLTEEEIRRVRDVTAEVAGRYYPESIWA